jgi:hypothetical protein
MGSGENAIPRPLASPPLAQKTALIKGGHTRHRSGARPGVSRSQSYESIENRNRTIVNEELCLEVSNYVCEVFKEDISDRAQARKFLWEFFD